MPATFETKQEGKQTMAEALQEAVKVERSFKPSIARLLQNIDEDRLAQLLLEAEKEEKYSVVEQEKKQHPLARYFADNSPFHGLSDKIIQTTHEIRQGMGERLYNKFTHPKY